MDQRIIYVSLLLLLSFGFLWSLWDSVRSIRLNRYLQKHGILTSSVITEARLTTGTEGYISRFKVTYQDQLGCLQQTAFSAQDSDDDYLYLVGGEVLIYYDPLQPKRAAMAEAVDSENRHVGIVVVLLGSGLAFCLYRLWELWPPFH